MDCKSLSSVLETEITIPDGTEDLSPEETTAFLVWDTSRAFTNRFTVTIARYGLTFGLWPFMRALWQQDGLTQRELSDRVRMKGPTTVAAIRDLEKRGFVRRVPSGSDRRKIHVFLTEGGRKIFDELRPAILDVNRDALKGLTDSEHRMVNELLRRIRSNVLDD